MKRQQFLGYSSGILLIISIYIIWNGLNLTSRYIKENKVVDEYTLKKADTMILFGSMLFGVGWYANKCFYSL